MTSKVIQARVSRAQSKQLGVAASHEFNNRILQFDKPSAAIRIDPAADGPRNCFMLQRANEVTGAEIENADPAEESDNDVHGTPIDCAAIGKRLDDVIVIAVISPLLRTRS